MLWLLTNRTNFLSTCHAASKRHNNSAALLGPLRFALSKSSISPHIQVYLASFLFNFHAFIAREYSNMIDDDSKYFCLSGDIPVGGPSTWHVVNWDQRRVVSVTMDGEQDDDSLAIEHFSRHCEQLSPEVYRIYVSHTGEVVSTYTDSENDPTYCIHYPSLDDAFLPEGIRTVRRNELEELKRLGPDADLVAYPPCAGESAKKVNPRCRY